MDTSMFYVQRDKKLLSISDISFIQLGEAFVEYLEKYKEPYISDDPSSASAEGHNLVNESRRLEVEATFKVFDKDKADRSIVIRSKSGQFFNVYDSVEERNDILKHYCYGIKF